MSLLQTKKKKLKSSTNEYLSFLNSFYELLNNLSTKSQSNISINISLEISNFFNNNSLPKKLDTLRKKFSLSSYEWQTLFFCSTLELNPDFLWLYSQFIDTYNKQYFSLELSSKLIGSNLWGLLSNESALIKNLLVNIDKRPPLMHASIRISENVLCYLIDVPYSDPKLLSFAKPVDISLKDEVLPESQEEALDQVLVYLKSEKKKKLKKTQILHLLGSDRIGKEVVILKACAQVHKEPYFIDACFLPDRNLDLLDLIRFLRTEAKLNDMIYIVDFQNKNKNAEDSIEDKERAFLAYALKYLPGNCIISSLYNYNLFMEYTLDVYVNEPNSKEKVEQWKNALNFIEQDYGDLIGNIVEQFSLSNRQIRNISMHLKQQFFLEKEGEFPASFLWNLCREQSRLDMSTLIRPLSSKLNWDDLILSENQRFILECIISQVKNRYQVYRKWGLADKENRGLGIVSLFCGPSGTGKTMSAEVVANVLNLDIYQVDLSKILSKYIGETQKNLEKVFSAAEKSCAILLFDEADALFGKRSDIKESRDRYSNMEVNYLLHRMENYSGLSILTTNLKSNVDNAFLRRFRFIIEYHYPNKEERIAIWKNVLTKKIPTKDIDIPALATLSLNGANIRSIAINAAFFASSSGKSLEMSHFNKAIELEYLKLERPLPKIMSTYRSHSSVIKT